MTTDYFQWMFIIVMLSSILLTCLSMILLRLTLDRRVRQALPRNKIYDSIYDEYFGIGRAIIFGWACVIPYFNHSPKLRFAYNDFDIRSFANDLEKIIAYTMIISGLTFITCIPIFHVTKWLGIFEWS